MHGQLASRPEALEGKTIAFLDCGKRGSAPILEGIARQIGAAQEVVALDFKKTSAHSCAARKLIDEIASTCDAVVYGVVN